MMKPSYRSSNKPARCLASAALLFAVNASADPADGSTSAPDAWHFDASAYLWGASIGGHSATGGEIDIGIKTKTESALGSRKVKASASGSST